MNVFASGPVLLGVVVAAALVIIVSTAERKP